MLGPAGQQLREQAQPAKPSDILEYYFRVRGGRRPLNEAKLILVGRGAVGKTSIVQRLVDNQFDPYEKKGICLRRDSWVSVMYAEELNSTKSSVSLQRTDRHEILGQKPADFQVSV